MDQDRDDKKTFSIGALSRATGVPVETLRTWERRYGVPNASRTPTGHRRYSSASVERLRRVKLALERGHRPSSVVGLSEVELDRLLGWSGARIPLAAAGQGPRATGADLHPDVEAWLIDVSSGDLDSLERGFRLAWAALSAETFVEERAAPFMYEIGERWARKEISVMQEHAASQRLRDFLAEHWRPISERSDGLRLICGGLSGDHHDLGCHMAATVLAVSGAKVIFLGGDTPVPELSRAVAAFGAVGVVISISAAQDPGRAAEELTTLRQQVPRPLPIVIGGSGAPPPPEGVHRLGALSQLTQWFATIASPADRWSRPRA